MNPTVQKLLQILGYADTAADLVLPFLGASEFVPLIDAVNALAQKIASAAQKQTPPLSVEIAAADAAAKAAELAEGLK